MFKHLLWHREMLIWAGIPLLVTFLVFCCQCLYWESKVKTQGVQYPPETFRAPINSALSVSGLILPLLCGVIGYLALQLVAPIKLIPLVVIAGLLGISMMVGLWNMFSMTASDGNIAITKDTLTWFVPQVVAQLCLLFLSIILLLIYIFVFFDLPKATLASNSAAFSFIARPPIDVGIDGTAVIRAWGSPTSVKDTAQGTEWHYSSINTEFIVLFDNGTVSNIIERKTQ